MKLCYLDTGVIVTPLLKNREQSVIDECQGWLEKVARGEIRALTSYLTWDEVTWVVGKASGAYERQKAIRAGHLLLGLKHLEFVPVDEQVTQRAQGLLTTFGFKPRDCIHASSALLHAGGQLLTLDSGFMKDVAQSTAAGLKVVCIGSAAPP
ncbi:type II toxin-antitoxin system VapC family toxin [Archangium sp.]|uniref:type II toxin-antitoxin system VapC family toxin n=1 Tax=Archangium sp. TaxID=1872627 RepID=UPI00286A485E|nr:type II toxin-antitoxin system VapC family toxin [Archangium sp.]